MDSIFNILKQISSTNSRNEKEAILKVNKHNILLRDILYFVYNPYIITGLSKKKISKCVTESTKRDIKSIYDLLQYLIVNNTGRDIDISKVQYFIKSQPEYLTELYEQIATKSLKIGVTAKTLNKVYGKTFIPQFNVMLADKYFKHEDKITGEFIVTRKLDGIRCVLIKENGSVKVFSRQGQPIEDLVEILLEAEKLPDNMIYDGELILRNEDNLASKDLYRKTVKVARKDGVKKNLILNCFDVLPVKEFKSGLCITKCAERKLQLHNILSEAHLEHIVEVPILYKGTDKTMVIKLLEQEVSMEHEGVMVNISNAPYECKRTKSILKVKKFNDADVKVVDILEGTGKNQDKLGAITVQFLHNNVIYECNCGSGFSDEERLLYWRNKELILNKIVTIGYFEVSENQNGGFGLRFPTWQGIIREDKDDISMY
ncbi:hypothetical protein LAV60_15630 [Clostridium sporogenes]|uniref:ATP-dependent DNA ligase n=1 Tax=Clostridium sporogenes TaxID=1509 RepID=UPI0022386F35|nr:hypothetical protein [Clostridium sporogenes]MCW6094602.1 hypothetical protein [Clostridium sporogenes]